MRVNVPSGRNGMDIFNPSSTDPETAEEPRPVAVNDPPATKLIVPIEMNPQTLMSKSGSSSPTEPLREVSAQCGLCWRPAVKEDCPVGNSSPVSVTLTSLRLVGATSIDSLFGSPINLEGEGTTSAIGCVKIS